MTAAAAPESEGLITRNPAESPDDLRDRIPKMRARVVEDEALGQATRIIEGETFENLGRNSSDLIRLDVHVRGKSGIAALDRLEGREGTTASIVFVAGGDERALAAFAQYVSDYFLKHLPERRGEALGALAAQVVKMSPEVEASPGRGAKIAIKSRGRTVFIDPRDVIAVEAQGKHVSLLVPGGSYLFRDSISAMTEKLKPYGFIRIHRSALVNRSFVEEVRVERTGQYQLRVKGGKEYAVTRTYKCTLESLPQP